MKITIWGINYAPEAIGIAPHNKILCDFLRVRGHEVRIVTAFPYYPAWKKETGDVGKLFRTDNVDGVPVHRCWHYVPSKVTTFKRIIHEASFAVTSFFRQLTLPRADAYIVISPPLLLGTTAWVLSWFKRAPFVFHVQDLQPDAALGMGMLKPNWITQSLYQLEKIAYKKAARVSGITGAITHAFKKKGVPEEKIILFPNSASIPPSEKIPPRDSFRAREGLSPQDFVVSYAGNLGCKQGLEVLFEAARFLRHPKIKIVVCGDGARREYFEELVKKEGFTNVRLLPLQPEQHYQQMLADSDVCVITQMKGTGSFFLPSKMLTTLAYGRPILGVADKESELSRAIEESGCGINLSPDDPEKLASAIEWLEKDRPQLAQMGQQGFQYIQQFERSKVLPQFLDQLVAMIEKKAASRSVTPEVNKSIPEREKSSSTF
jgi:colanic acid biosynthesis glycosyl transferase WcaI